MLRIRLQVVEKPDLTPVDSLKSLTSDNVLNVRAVTGTFIRLHSAILQWRAHGCCQSLAVDNAKRSLGA